MELNPNDDGNFHINIYSKGKTHLGRWLSNFTHSPFTHPEYGRFESMEGFWYWASTGMEHHVLKSVWGFKAKQVGREFPKIKNSKFRAMIKSAMRCKLKQHPSELENFVNSKLPFEHYYYYGNVQDHRVKLIIPPSGKMLIDILNELREELRAENKGK